MIDNVSNWLAELMHIKQLFVSLSLKILSKIKIKWQRGSFWKPGNTPKSAAELSLLFHCLKIRPILSV